MRPAPRAARRSWTRFAAAVLLGAAAVGCNSLPEAPGRHVDVLLRGTLEEVQPVDVVVVPIVDDSGTRDVPKVELREAFQRGLILRRYTPLALDYVDSHVVEAAYRPGSSAEDAVFKVMVRSWDLKRLQSHGELGVEVEAWMLQASDGAKLWGARLTRTLNLKQELDRHETSWQAFQKACEVIADDLLEVMPARTPKP